MPTLPTSLALTSIADGSLIIAADHRNNYTAIQTAVNSLITTLGAGATTQFLAGNGTTLSWLQPPATELAYNEFTAAVTISATSAATATTVVTASAVTFDGATAATIEFQATRADTAAVVQVLNFELYDGATDLGDIGALNNIAAAAQLMPVRLMRRLTPSAAAHTYSMRAWVSTANNATVQAGVGGAAVFMPGFIRILKV